MNPTTSTQYVRPASSVIEQTEGFIIEADMPGVAREGIELTVEKGILTIVGRRTPSTSPTRTLHRETSGRDYRRAFELGRAVDSSKAAAQFNEGVLRVFLPKSEALKPRRIDVLS